jgi:dTDP-4-amino-4,6-dideoxygalactose transaminase
LALVDRIPVAAPYENLRKYRAEIDAAIARVLDSGVFVLGPEVEALEAEFANFVGAPFAIGVNSGTDALALALKALDIGPGDEVITVSHTAVATVAAIEQVGATPILVDVEERHLTIDLAQVKAALSPATSAVVAVHIYGHVCDLEGLASLCSQAGLALLEDCSQAHGAKYGDSHVGTFGDVGVFSCYPTKNLGAIGDAGIAVTKDEALARRIRRIRQYGWEERNSSLEPGFNSRLDELQAAVLRVKLSGLDDDVRARRLIASIYDEALRASNLTAIGPRRGTSSAYHLYVVRHPRRDNLALHLEAFGIDSAIHYPFPVHSQVAYKSRIRHNPNMDVTNTAAREILSLPLFPEMPLAAAQRVLKVVSTFDEF